MRGSLPRFFFAIVWVAGHGVAAAAGLGFLADSPMSKFTEDDLKLMNGAVDEALTASAVGVRTGWSNDKTGSSGDVTPQREFESKGRPCRDLKIVNRHKTLEASGIYTMCREDGRWKLAQ